MRFAIKLACFTLLTLVYTKTRAQQPSAGNLIFSTTQETSTQSDSIQQYTIRNIIITGNRKTNPDIILRELSFQIDEGYPLSTISHKFTKARKQLMNTGLFTDVIVSLQSLTGYDVIVSIQVQEKWYIWVQPILKPVDKTFHEWWKEGDRNMDRINYGIRIAHNNFTGRNDKLRINLTNGYTKQLSIQYFGLFLDRELKWSVNGGFAIGMNREVNYKTENDKPVQFKSGNDFLRSYLGWFGEVSYRPAIKTRHTFGVSYGYEDFADTISKLNPHFASGHSIVRSPELRYTLSYFDVDYIPYPTKGYIYEFTIKRKGFNDPLNLLQLTAKASASWALNENYYFNLRGVGMVKLPFNQPYMTRQFIGYEDQFMQGYEYYVIDGVAGGYAKASIARSLVKTHLFINSRRFQCLNNIPLKIYAKAFVNAGYVYNRFPGQNELSNKLLYSGGVGLDILTFNDFMIKLEWSFNRLGENGLYLHQSNYF
jgi:outer membrane protein assembly factor BamA